MDATAADDAFTLAALPAQRVVQRTDVLQDTSDMAPRVAAMFYQVRELMDAAGVHPTGDPVALYAHGDDGTTVVTAYPCEDEVTGADRVDLPAVERALTTRAEGPIDNLPTAWQALWDEVERRGLTSGGQSREVYREMPPDSPQAWIVELQQPLA